MSRTIKGVCLALFLALASLVAAASPGTAQEKLAPERALATRTGWWFYTNITPQELGAAIERTKSRIVDLEINSVSPLKVSATLVENSGPYASGWWWYVDQTGESLSKLLQQNNARLTDLNAYRVNGQLRFAAVMVTNTGANGIGWWWYVDQTPEALGKLLDQNKARLIGLDGYTSGNQTLYAAVMVSNQGPKGTGWWWYLGQTPDQVGKLLDANKARILRIKRSNGGGDRFDVIMVPNTGAEGVRWWWYTGVSAGNLVELAGRYNARLFDVATSADGTNYTGIMIDNGMPRSGDCGGQMAGVDRIVTNWMKRYGLPGASVAVVKDSRLVYACGFGYGDLAKVDTVEPRDRFRLASISKPITETAIRKLADDGKLKVGDKMLDRLGSAKPSEPYADSQLKNITIQHLLDHQAGWNTKKLGFDPVNHSEEVATALGTSRPASCRDTITYMFKNHKLSYPPGSPPAGEGNYSNFGYCILGRIIEAVSGQTYEAYVRQAILSPVGITRMQIGHSLIEGRAANEVYYYDVPFARTVKSIFPSKDQVPAPYGAFNVETGDSNGGWIASATDLARFARFATGRGWGYEGGLPGTATRVIRDGDVVVVVLFNASLQLPTGVGFHTLTDDMVASVSTWPTGDLWSKYGYR
jgi:CubicO group peptidase (beta-lactamase class C family)